MLADDLENSFSRIFNGKPSMFTDEILWVHGNTQYRLRYKLKYVRDLGSFVCETFLDDTTSSPGHMRMLSRKEWQPDHTVQQAAQWVAKLVLTRDAG
jgi:hypothetical protein